MTDPEPTMTVHQAFSKVMGAVQGIRKGERNQQQNFNFRGIDAVVNAVGPALREHGVFIIPQALSIDVERYESRGGASMKNVTVLMKYEVFGPAGDSFVGVSYGEASDAGDKSVSKAQSVAYRTFLLQGLTVPTDEPDPDASLHERAPQRPPEPWMVARDELVAAVKDAGIDAGQFAAWAISPAGPSINLRECRDVEALQGLTRRVKSEGAQIIVGDGA